MSPTLNHTKALYIDTEMTCWGGEPPAGYRKELIQLGICEVNLNALEITRCIRFYIKPKPLWEISSFCTKLTGITDEQIKKLGRPYAEVANTITNEWGPKNKMIHTWGDETECLERAALVSAAANPWGRNVFDLSYAFRSSFNLTRNLSLGDALNYLGLKFEGRPHDALNDAKNTARLHLEMMRRLRNTLPAETELQCSLS